MHDPRPLPFQGKDLELLSVEDVSTRLRVSHAFVRLCLDAGCPTQEGRLSAAEVLHWLFDNYAAVRAIAGFPAFEELEGLTPPAAKRLRMANALFTLLEFGESRASDPEAKAEIRKVWQTVDRAIDAA